MADREDSLSATGRWIAVAVFVGMVVERRNMPKEAVLPLADGRIFTGRQAVAANLVDGIGGENEAIAWLESQRGIAPGLPVRELHLNRAVEAAAIHRVLAVVRLAARRAGHHVLVDDLERRRERDRDPQVRYAGECRVGVMEPQPTESQPADAERVRSAVAEWHRSINPGGFTGDACFTGGCSRAFANNGCGGMEEGRLVF